ncbi:MAG TPA: class I SAM-dependent methyltransferase [Fimbriiglobus sp.]|nr:class I SAM-dependent methyltransferase [Fimbriiglobus sp.]
MLNRSFATFADPAAPAGYALPVDDDFPAEAMARAQGDPGFAALCERFDRAGVTNWLREDEKALHYGVGMCVPGDGTLVEVGSFEGGAAVFLAGGLARRGGGELVCVDPHLGGPPWLGMAPHQRTLAKFRRNVGFCGVADRVRPWVGDSASVAAVWPAEPIDAVFIDGDHSFRGALGDFECWVPKVRAGGLVMIDDADDPGLPELLDLIELVKTLGGVRYLGQVGGVALFRRESLSAAAMLCELHAAMLARGVHRPWNLAPLHALALPKSFGRSFTDPEPGMGDAYQLAYLARCGPGAYGCTTNAAESLKAVLRAVGTDRADGPVVELPDAARPCRAIACTPDEAGIVAKDLMPGGVLLTRNPGADTHESQFALRRVLLAAGLEGCGWGGMVHWGVWRPAHLSADAIIEYAVRGFAPAG